MKYKLILSCAVGLSVSMLATSFYPKSLPTNETAQELNSTSESLPETENLMEKSSESTAEFSIETESLLTQEITTEETALPETEDSQAEVESEQEETQKEYKYAETSVNIRNGPGKNYEIIDTVEPGTKFSCLGEKEGWTEVAYKEVTGYVYSSYLTSKKPTAESQNETTEKAKIETESQTEIETKSVAEEMSVRPGMIGRISIPSLGISVAVFSAKADQSSQTVVDAKDSAAYIEFGEQGLIIDNYQDFKAIINSKVGSTVLYFDSGDSRKAFICTELGRGTNTTTDILDQNGVSISGRNEGGLCLYTSKESASSIYYTLWQPQ